MSKKTGVIIILVIVIIAVTSIGYIQYREKQRYYTFLNNQYQRMYYDLVGNVQTVSDGISKLMVTSQEQENQILYTTILINAYSAQDNLAQLPLNHRNVEKIQKYLNQVGDYVLAIAAKNIKGDKLNPKDVNNLIKLQGYADEFSSSLQDIKAELVDKHSWKTFIEKGASDAIDNTVKGDESKMHIQTQLVKFQEKIVEYPELIYDGPFSEHSIKGLKPRLKGKSISKEEAKKLVEKEIDDFSISSISEKKERNSAIGVYSFTLKHEKEDRKAYVDVSKIDSRVAMVMDNRPVKDKKISSKEAVKKANEFLVKNGFKDMRATFSLEDDNRLVINYAYVQDEVMMYPDLIKIKVALDDGSIVGFDSTKYLTSHYKRSIKEPKLTKEQAIERVGERLENKEAARLCYIPTTYLKELYCYEIEGTYNGDTYFIYINAITGEEEKILKLVRTKQGILMI